MIASFGADTLPLFADLTPAIIFKSVDFTGADFEGTTDFSGADFTGANVTGVIWGVGVTCPNKTVIQKAGDVCIQGGKVIVVGG